MMNHRRTWLAFFCVSLLLPAFAFAQAKADDLPLLFNGKDLTGWKVPNPNPWWTVKDGVLVGEQTDAKGKGDVLYTEKSYKDVIIETEVRFGEGIDSGIMVRKPEAQIQIGVSRSLKKDMTASIYAGKRGYPGKAQGVEQILKLNEWNTLRVQVIGDNYKVWLNGKQVLDYTDPAFPEAAPIGLQIHPGVKMKVEFRNLRAKSLDGEGKK